MEGRMSRDPWRPALLAAVALAACDPAWAASAGPPAAPDAAGSDAPCKSATDEYLSAFSKLSRACARDADCALADLAWSNCTMMHAVAKADATRDRVGSLRDLARQRCHFVFAPCAYVPAVARCVAGACKPVEGFESPGPPESAAVPPPPTRTPSKQK